MAWTNHTLPTESSNESEIRCSTTRVLRIWNGNFILTSTVIIILLTRDMSNEKKNPMSNDIILHVRTYN